MNHSSSPTASYQSPLTSRYASSQMIELFSSDTKYRTWRELWVALAEAQKNLGLNISSEQIDQMKSNIDKIDYHKVREYEKELKHDVMAHIHAFGDQSPLAKPIIHLGATSCFVTDNGDLIQYRCALKIILAKLVQVIRNLSHLARKYQSLPCLAYTHFQPAQPTTLGKRLCLWLYNFTMDYSKLKRLHENLPFLGIKGATGTQASLLALFNNNQKTVRSCDQAVAAKFGFKNLLEISGQTYPRKVDLDITQCLSQIAVSSNKLATDLRLLAHLGEIEEPFKDSQIGSSAMPYKRNPIYSERICSLSRFVINLGHNTEDTAAHQWLERSLDDSANKRLTLPEAFLTLDSVFNLVLFVTSQPVINQRVIQTNLERQLPFIATENILMALVKKGGDRQELHERLRQHSLNVKNQMKEEGQENDLVKRLVNDPMLALSQKELDDLLDIKQFVGMCEEQVNHFLNGSVMEILKENEDLKPHQENPVI